MDWVGVECESVFGWGSGVGTGWGYGRSSYSPAIKTSAILSLVIRDEISQVYRHLMKQISPGLKSKRMPILNIHLNHIELKLHSHQLSETKIHPPKHHPRINMNTTPLKTFNCVKGRTVVSRWGQRYGNHLSLVNMCNYVREAGQ